MKAVAISIGAVLLLMTIAMNGQAVLPVEKPELPPGPLIEKRAPDFSKWIVKSVVQAKTRPHSESGAGQAAASGESISRVITKTGPIIHVQMVDDQKRVWSVWVRDGKQIVEFPDRQSVGFVAASDPHGIANPLWMDFSNGDFQGFDWVSKDTFAGVQDVMGRKCLVFTTTKKIINYSVTATAAVDFNTRLPMSLVDENGATDYQYLQTPTEMQTLPSEVEASIAREHASEKALQKKPSTPF